MSIASCNKDNPNEPVNTTPAKYTIMFYGSGGGNVDCMLDGGIKDYVKAMGMGNKDVRFAVMWNMSKTDKSYSEYEKQQMIGEWGKCYRYELTDKTDLTKEGYKQYIYKNASEVPMYKQSTLTEYINWVKKNVPAENYIFVPTDHGGGFDLDHEMLTKAIDDARVTAITGINRMDAGGNYVMPKHGGYSVGISIYSKAKDETYQKHGANYTSSAFDAATQWSKWFDVNQISVMDGNNLNPCNDSSWELFWLED